MAKLTVNDVNWRGKKVFVRVDYNVPLKEKDGKVVITDLTRILATLPTLEVLLKQGAILTLAAHLGRPDGKREPSMSLRPVAEKLAEILHRPVAFLDDCIGEKVEKTVSIMQPGDVLLLENVRFHAGEEANDPAFAETLAKPFDAYVNDAFGAAHRAHASTAGVAKIIGARGGVCAGGLLMEKELRFLGDELEKPARPFVVIMGGAKVSDKIKVIERLLGKADTLLIGGAMAYTFKASQGVAIGKSKVEKDHLGTAQSALDFAKSKGVSLLIPTDDIVATPAVTDKVDKKGKPVIEFQNPHVNSGAIAAGEAGLDIGPETAARYAQAIASAKTILWNGPMGMFEDKRFAEGTLTVARAVAEATRVNGAKSIIGGGDSVTALNQAGLGDQVTWMSTGGGASLEFLEGIELPGVAALQDKPAAG